MYDVDGNGVIDQDEMTKIVQVYFIFLRVIGCAFNIKENIYLWMITSISSEANI